MYLGNLWEPYVLVSGAPGTDCQVPPVVAGGMAATHAEQVFHAHEMQLGSTNQSAIFQFILCKTTRHNFTQRTPARMNDNY